MHYRTFEDRSKVKIADYKRTPRKASLGSVFTVFLADWWQKVEQRLKSACQISDIGPVVAHLCQQTVNKALVTDKTS